MPLPAGTRLGPYEILSPLGSGGMGEVYRARDTRLGREVAVKVLPAHLSSSPEVRARFEREARAVSSLNHPNICTLHDVGREGETDYLVMEMVEGETLALRLSRGALPLAEVLKTGAQIAGALDRAHRAGVVHRDLKPGNVMLTKSGAKLLDFGLAKGVGSGSVQSNLTMSPTVTTPLTATGTIVGTFQYLAPEQLEGREADVRSDLFALGVVLYEMATGRRAFTGKTQASLFAAILKEEPRPIRELDSAAPPALDRLVRLCLRKDPDERIQSAHDVRLQLEAIAEAAASRDEMAGAAAETVEGGAAAAAAGARRHPGRSGLLGAGLGVGLLAGVAAGWLGASFWSQTETFSPPSMRTLTYSGGDREPSAAPDGRLIAYTSDRPDGTQIWLKQVPGGDEVALTRGPLDTLPRFSPDGSQMLFIRQDGTLQSLYKVPVVGGEPRKVVDDAADADWSPDGTRIVFIRNDVQEGVATDIVMIVDAAGQGARELSRAKNLTLATPRWSPDGSTIALAQTGTENGASTLLLVGVADGATRQLTPPAPLGRLTASIWMGAGHALLYAKAETLVTGQSVASSGRLMLQDISSGEARTLMWIPSATGSLDVLSRGSIVLGTGALRQNLREVPLDAAGTETAGAEERWLTRGNSIDRQPTFSPDGKWMLFSSNRSGNLDLWKMSTETGAIRRITEDLADDWDPAFTRDGRSILWSSNRSGHFEIWMCAADGTGARQVTQDGYDAENPTTTPGDTWIVYNSGNPAHTGIWKMRADGTEAALLVPGSWSTPDVSPDGQHVAFRTGGNLRVLHVARLSDGALAMPPMPLPSSALNARPRWMPDGRSLIFTGENAEGRSGIFIQRFEPGQDTTGTRRPLTGFEVEDVRETLGISPDGRRLIVSVAETQDSLMLAEGLAGVEPPVRGK